ncbi:MAG TPA: efflux RND transporter periplasmic adaptor subunit [Kofleriaceae bacterium]|jgi:HlyD family secretion protein|nr:efflux RND transporter periplasmic adaptor subunit [Kofleriaceae bacterium]
MTTAARSRARLIIPALVLAVLAWYAWHRWQQAHAPFEWSGTVEVHQISLGSRAGGRVQKVLVKEGDRIKPGDAIVALEPGDWPAQLQQAQAQLEMMQATLDKLKAGSRPEEIAAARARSATAQAVLQETTAGTRSEEVAAAEDRLAGQQVAVVRAQKDAERLHKLAAAGAAVPADVDNADLAVQAANAQRDAAAHQLDELRHGARREQVAQAAARAAEQRASEQLVAAGSRVEDLRAAEAQVQGAQGKVDQIRTMIDELTVKAPVAARVEALDLRPGDILAPNQTAVTLVEDDQLYVRIYVPETELGHVAVGQRVAIHVDSFPGQAFDGVVQRINSVGEYSPRNLQTADERADQVFATRIGITSGGDRLRAGMAATITVPRD